MKKTKYTHRLLARIVVEAETPLAVGSGEKNMLTDSLVATDVNGLPYIPGTAIAGVLRHAIGEETAKKFFGDPDKNNITGSEIIFTEAKLIGKDGKPIDGLKPGIDRTDAFYNHYFNLPIRQHNRIGDSGAVEGTGKFDEQIVYKGSHFCFEIEMLSDKEQSDDFETVLKKINSKEFVLGSGTTCGFGELKVVSCKTRVLDLRDEAQRELYAKKSSSLAAGWEGWEDKAVTPEADSDGEVTVYTLELQPADFFLFGSGFGDDDADMTPVREQIVKWNADGKPSFSEQQILIPATSVKGAIAHRTAYHYNKLSGNFVENGEAKTGADNEAVRELFGYADDKGKSQKGNVAISDCHISSGTKDQVVPHVAIDRFTGGTIDGALFQEKTVYGKGADVKLTVQCKAGKYSARVQESLEAALADVCKSLLPLGGGVNRGNGAFKGTLTKNGEKLYENQGH